MNLENWAPLGHEVSLEDGLKLAIMWEIIRPTEGVTMSYSSAMHAVAAGQPMTEFDPSDVKEPDYELMRKIASHPRMTGVHYQAQERSKAVNYVPEETKHAAPKINPQQLVKRFLF